MGDVAVKVSYKKNGTRLVYDPEWLPTIPHVRPPDPPSPGIFERCRGCPYPGHGFICWGCDGETCLRTQLHQIMSRPKSVASAG